jgi:hypothetical protein
MALAAAFAASSPSAVSGNATACSKATAARVATQLHVGVDPTTGRTPIAQVLCGPFLGPGSQALVASVAIPSCGRSIEWAVFRFAAGTWQLVMKRNNGADLAAVGSDIRETMGVLRPGDPHCFPSASRSRVWHWNGSRFTATAWTYSQEDPWKAAAARARFPLYRPTVTPGFKSTVRVSPCEVPGGGVQVSATYRKGSGRDAPVFGFAESLHPCGDPGESQTVGSVDIRGVKVHVNVFFGRNCTTDCTLKDGFNNGYLLFLGPPLTKRTLIVVYSSHVTLDGLLKVLRSLTEVR